MAPAGEMATGGGLEGRRVSTLQALHCLGIVTETVKYQKRGERDGMEGIFCKNLLVKDRKSRLFLLICHEDHNLDLKHVKQELSSHHLCQGNLSFSNADTMYQVLGSVPGALSPLGIHLDIENKVKVILDQTLLQTDRRLNFHPLDPELTTLITASDLVYFLNHHGHSPLILDLEYCQ